MRIITAAISLAALALTGTRSLSLGYHWQRQRVGIWGGHGIQDLMGPKAGIPVSGEGKAMLAPLGGTTQARREVYTTTEIWRYFSNFFASRKMAAKHRTWMRSFGLWVHVINVANLDVDGEQNPGA